MAAIVVFLRSVTSINKISLIQFKNYQTANFVFSGPITCITGPNGSGKTNLLDAIYFLCYTKSYFSSYQHHAVQHGTDGFRVTGHITHAGKPEDVISCKWTAGKKELSCNQTEYEKLTDHIGRYSAVIIAPDDIELINEHSEHRRKWIDGILSQSDRQYLERLMRYQKVLQQRNAWLKMQATQASAQRTELEYYDMQLSADATYIFEQRKSFLLAFKPLLAQYYSRLAGTAEAIDMLYTSDLLQKPLATWLQQHLDHDMRYQRTLRGIHKDDWELQINGMLLRQFGSQGQKKSFLFALKLAQYAWLSEHLGHKPILLLDDIFEKLDQQRMEALLNIIKGPDFGQVVLTDTHAGRVRQAFGSDSQLCFIELLPTTAHQQQA